MIIFPLLLQSNLQHFQNFLMVPVKKSLKLSKKKKKKKKKIPLSLQRNLVPLLMDQLWF